MLPILDVQIVNNHLFVINAKERIVADVDDCDTAAEEVPIILDGVYVFDLAGPSLEVDWDWTDTSDVTVDYTTANGREETSYCEAGYWLAPGSTTTHLLDGTDYLHTNSLWVDAAQRWVLSAHDVDHVYTVDRDSTSYTYSEVVSDIDGKGLGGDWTFDATFFPGEFLGQHTVHWGPTGDLVLFDNHNAGDTRGVVYDVDASAMTLEATAQYTMEDSGSPISCLFGGSGWITLGGNAFLTCPSFSGHALLNEFNGSDSVNWAVTMECDSGTPNYDPVGFAFRAYPNVW